MAEEQVIPNASQANTENAVATATTSAVSATQTAQTDAAKTATPAHDAGVASVIDTPKTDAKTDEAKKPEGTEPTKTQDQIKAETANKDIPTPDKYEYKLPEGVKLDGELRKTLDGFVAEAKLSPELAQKGVEFFLKTQQEQANAAKAANESFFANETKSLETDKAFGGQKYQETKALINKGYQALYNELNGHPAEQKAFKEMFVDNKLANLRPISLALRGFADRYLREAQMVQTDNTAAAAPQAPFATGRKFNLHEAVSKVFGG